METLDKRQYGILNRDRQKKTRITRVSVYIDRRGRVKSVCVYRDNSVFSTDYTKPETIRTVLNMQAIKKFMSNNKCRTVNYFKNNEHRYTCRYYGSNEFNIERNVMY